MAPQGSQTALPEGWEFALFRDDTVRRRGGTALGLVEGVGGVSDSEEEEYSEDEDLPPLEKGQARVCWLNSEQTVTWSDIDTVTLEDLEVVDRSVVHHDIVALRSDPVGQTGMVTAVKKVVDVKYVKGGQAFTSVPAESLKSISNVREGSLVVYQNWLGRVTDGHNTVTLRFNDQKSFSICRISNLTYDSLEPVDCDMDPEEPYFPGMKVRRNEVDLRRAKWLKGKYKPRFESAIATVISVSPGKAYVRWLAAAPGDETEINEPDEVVRDSSELDPLPGFLLWQIGDRGLLNSENTSREKGTTSYCDDSPYCVEVTKTYTTCSITWQDGTEQHDLSSVDLIHIKHIGEHDFWPEEIVIEKLEGDSLPEDIKVRRRLGIVECVEALEKTCQVKWIGYCDADGANEVLSNDLMELPGLPLGRSEISCYDLLEHPDYNYSIGDVVIRLDESENSQENDADGTKTSTPKKDLDHADLQALENGDKLGDAESDADGSEEQDSDGWETEPEESEDEKDAEGESVAARKRASTRKDWVGEVLAVQAALVQVRWLSGKVVWMKPSEVYVVESDDEGEEEWEEDEEDDMYEEEMPGLLHSDVDWTLGPDHSSAQTPSSSAFMGAEYQHPNGVADRRITPPSGTDDARHPISTAQHPIHEHHSPSARSSVRFLQPLANQVLSNVSSGIRGLIRDVSTSFRSSSQRSQQPIQVPSERYQEMPDFSENAANNGHENHATAGMSDTPVQPDLPDTAEGEVGDRFQVIEEIPAHHFEKEVQCAPAKQFAKTIRKEWKLLSANLPSGISVKVSEERMDLVRAVIDGPTHTPYEDGMFFFDLFLPPTYPQVPPCVYFHSYGLRINPNLYESGRVCLSLLGTWDGESVENWNPETSNLLQTLISIQGLVLVPEPYFNEAGYDKQLGTMEGDHNSRLYNEGALLLVLRHMIATVSNPVQPFEGEVKAHFTNKAPAIIQRCERILEANPHQCEGSDEAEGEDRAKGWADKSMPERATKGFVISLAKILPKLKTSLASCSV